MKLSIYHTYMLFDILNTGLQKIGEVQLLIDKEKDFEKWKNPNTVAPEAIDHFKDKIPQWKHENLRAYYTGDLVPATS